MAGGREPGRELAAGGCPGLAFVERGAALSQLVTESAAQRIEADVGPLPAGPINPPKPDPRAGKLDGGGSDSGGCAHCSWTDEDDYLQSTAALGFALIGLCGVLRRRRRSNDG